MNPAPAKFMQIYFKECSQYKHQTLYVALTQFLKMRGISHVTVRRGIMGYGTTGIVYPQKRSPFLSKIPIVLECIDSPEKIEEVFPEIMEIAKGSTCIVTDALIWHE